MANILKEIIDYKRVEVAQRKTIVPIEKLKEQAEQTPKCRNFYKAVTKQNPRGINIIAEVKKASPSAGLIRPDFDPVQIAKIYEQSGADAISVLTDEKYFQGKLEYLTQVKNAVSVPVLRKDFIIDEYQIYEARAAGADAILLIAETFEPTEGRFVDLMILAAELTLTVLLEVHCADSLLRARSMIGFPKAHYSIIGINNRNLETMKVDLNTTIRLAELADLQKGLVAESGLKTREDIQKVKRCGASAVLIGETLCKSPDITAKFRELFS
ncbi:MAG: Indole-3-glycerol phosphate synthase [Planctomycetes bacterium ADurb.Bin401]|nr:MAG: Indole-3-glycerol phosphate synthase [Planctomycetes bacterium ADurb.Bin401]